MKTRTKRPNRINAHALSKPDYPLPSHHPGELITNTHLNYVIDFSKVKNTDGLWSLCDDIAAVYLLLSIMS